jgi:hypothetical protein
MAIWRGAIGLGEEEGSALGGQGHESRQLKIHVQTEV